MRTGFITDGRRRFSAAPHEVQDIDSRDKAIAIAKAALDKKAEFVRVLDVSRITSLADYFVICSGNTDRQVHAIADEIERVMRDARERPHHVEGMPQCRWVLMDYSDVVVHVFEHETRQYYNLDRLWADAEELDV